MSNQRTLTQKHQGIALALVVSVGVIGAILWATTFSKRSELTREPASAPSGKTALAYQEAHGHIKHTRKLLGPLESEIITSDSPKPGETFVIKAVVKSSSDLDHVESKWSIPPGVEVLSGQIEQTFTNLKANEPQELELTLKLISDQNEKIFFQVRSQKNSMHFSHASQFNTLLQSEINKEKRALIERNQEYLNSVHKRHKIFQ